MRPLRLLKSSSPFSAAFLVAFLLFPILLVAQTPEPKLSVTHYDLHFHIFPQEQRYEGESRLTIENRNTQPTHEIPFVLYRSLEVTAVADASGAPLAFRQSLVKLTGEPAMQVNAVTVTLQPPLNAAARTTFTVKFRGTVSGYPEATAYVRDHVSEDYTLLRPDSLVYPIVAGTSLAAILGASQAEFSYTLTVDVPTGLVAASGGTASGQRENGARTTFEFQSTVPASRIDVAVAKFKILRDASGDLEVYALAQDLPGAERVLNAMEQVIVFYTDEFGPAPVGPGYRTIEIPEGYGSQAGPLYSLLQASAFHDPSNIHELYHEMAHAWNVRAKPNVQRTRWFDEAFASYFEALAERNLDGEKAFADRMNEYREHFRQQVAKDSRAADTPIIDYGKYELGDCSYTKGAWSLYVLHTIVGDDTFRKIMREFFIDFEDTPADFADFEATARDISHRDLKQYFHDWIDTTESSKLLLGTQTVNEMARRYQ